MMRNKIRLDTFREMQDFVNLASTFPANDKIVVTDGARNFISNAKSMLGVMCTCEWDDIYLECEHDHYSAFAKFIVE